ncbi:PIN domain-containing protein [Leifsonia poae]|uniref:PIN domain-containing protein n=1 Tax=Leifsonia poae TaxID=110933 RepID=UPI003D69B2E4
MILLDTNVVSELTKPRPEPRVVAWLESWERTELYISSVTITEMLAGANRMSDGRYADEKAEPMRSRRATRTSPTSACRC